MSGRRINSRLSSSVVLGQSDFADRFSGLLLLLVVRGRSLSVGDLLAVLAVVFRLLGFAAVIFFSEVALAVEAALFVVFLKRVDF